MTSLGETLRRARIERKLELNGIAEELKISASMLQAIEEERFDKLPGGVFARSFVRQYARLLEVDESEIEDELTRVLEPPSELPQIAHNAHPPQQHEIPLPRVAGWQAIGDQSVGWFSSAWALALVVIAMLACAGAYAWWQRARHPVVAREHPPVAASAPAPAPEAARPATPPATKPAVDTAAAAAAPAPREPEPPAEQPSPEPAPAATADAPTPALADLPEADPNAPVRVELTAQQPTWISVRTDGKYLFSGTLDANQSRTVGANQTVWLRVGNAAGVEIRLNGNPIGPLGGTGRVRTLQFTSGGFQILPPEVPKPAPPTESPNPF